MSDHVNDELRNCVCQLAGLMCRETRSGDKHLILIRGLGYTGHPLDKYTRDPPNQGNGQLLIGGRLSMDKQLYTPSQLGALTQLGNKFRE